MAKQRTSTEVPAGTSPAAAVRAARSAKGFEKAPSARRGRKRGGKGKRSDDEDYDARSGDLVDKFRQVFARDERPDAPTASLDDAERQRRNAYMAKSEQIAAGLLAKGRPRDSRGRFARSVTVTTHGAVQIRGAGGQIREVVRAPYRSTSTGRVSGNINEPTTRDPKGLREAVDARLEAFGSKFFNDRAGFSPARRTALRQAFQADRERRGWPVPEW